MKTLEFFLPISCNQVGIFDFSLIFFTRGRLKNAVSITRNTVMRNLL